MIIKGNKADANADFLRSGHDRGRIHDAGRAAPTSRSSASPTPTTGSPRTPRPRWSSSSRPTRTRSTPSCPRTTAWPAAWSRRSRPGPRRQGAAIRSGRRQGRPQPRRAGHADGRVWKDSRLLGIAAGEAAAQLCATGPRSTRSPAPRRSRRRVATMSAPSCSPQPITKANLNDVLDGRLDHQGQAVQGRDRRLRRGLLESASRDQRTRSPCSRPRRRRATSSQATA